MDAPGGGLTASQQVRLMFYALQPNESAFPSLQEVPDYVNKATPLFIVLMLLEFVVSWVWRHQASVRVNDGITSLSAGVLSRLPECCSSAWSTLDLLSLRRGGSVVTALSQP